MAENSAIEIARWISALIERSRINLSTEISAHVALADILRREGLVVETEVSLSATDRIDLLVEHVGIEVKVKGARRAVFAQLERYASHDRIGALVLATGAAWPTSMREVGGKPFFTASLSRGWL